MDVLFCMYVACSVIWSADLDMFIGRFFRWNLDPEDKEISQLQSYAPSISVDDGDLWLKLCEKSQVHQMTAIHTAIKQQRLLDLGDFLCLYHCDGAEYLKGVGFHDYICGQRELQRSQSSVFFANDSNLDLTVCLGIPRSFLRSAAKGSRPDPGTKHVIIVPCWRQSYSKGEVRSAFDKAFKGKGVLHCVYSTAPVAQCCGLARSSSGGSATSSGSDIDQLTDQHFFTNKVLPYAYLVIGYSLGDDKVTGKRAPPTDAPEDARAGKRRITSVNHSAAEGSNTAGQSVSSLPNLASPVVKREPTKPLTSTAAQQASLQPLQNCICTPGRKH